MKPDREAIAREVRARIEANRKEAKGADDGRRILAKVAERTAQELESLLAFIELDDGELKGD